MTSQATSLDELLDKIDGIGNVLAELNCNQLSDDPRLLHLRFRENQVQMHSFVEVVATALVNYAIPLRKRKNAIQAAGASSSGGNTQAVIRLQQEAIRLLVEYGEKSKSRYGEIGELISYVIAVTYLRAPQIGSKLALKTSSQMLCHGVDGLHVRKESDGSVTLFLLESKLSPDAATASREFCESVTSHLSSRKAELNELRIITDLSNLDELTGDERDAAKAFFNLYAEEDSSLNRRERHVASLVYSENHYSNTLPIDNSKPLGVHEEHFRKNYLTVYDKLKVNLTNQAKEKNLDLGSCLVFFLAVPDVNELKKYFAELNSGHMKQ